MTIARRIQVALAVLGAGAATLLFAAPSNAATSTYHPNPEAQAFEPTAGGWTGSTDATGLCLLQPLLCPAVDNDHEGSGGAAGASDGFLRTTAAGVVSVAGNVEGTWQSPAFTYNGVAGAAPDEVSFSMARRADVGGLLLLLGSSEYSVELFNVTDQDSLEVVDATPHSDTDSWSSIATVDVDPAQLDVGDEYRIRISTEFSAPVGVLVGARADYDDVVLRASTADPGDGDGDGVPDATDNCPAVANPGQEDADSDGIGNACEADTDADTVIDDVDNCDNVANADQLDTDGDGIGNACDSTPNGPGPGTPNPPIDPTGSLRDSVGAAGVIRGNKLLVPVKCPKSVTGKCRVKLVGYEKGKRSKRVTTTGKVAVKPGKKKIAVLRIKPRFLSAVSAKQKMVFRVKVRSGSSGVDFFRKLRVIRR